MRFQVFPGFIALMAGVVLCVPGRGAQGDASQADIKGLPARAAPAEYQSQTQAGAVTIAAEFKGHMVPTMQGNLTTEEYVVVEVGLFGPPEARLYLSSGDFSLRINGRKVTLPGRPYGMVFESLKDPEYEPPGGAASKSKGGLRTGGGDRSEDGSPPPVAKIPVPVQRAMAQRVQRAALPEGDRPLPQAGLLFFQYRGKAQGIRAVELIYEGPAGAATLKLQP
ncbi:MAG: hypothetical protein IT159_01475 [Bryobacterales bacterium]|nr:hypothetical protein [Bryobacterales bacterium]